MALKHFGDAARHALPGLEDFPNSSNFDHLIVGWTRYWNEILKPMPMLDPRLVKALIASESSFRPKVSAKNQGNPARGLMQVTDQTRAILSDEKGELKNFLVNLSRFVFLIRSTLTRVGCLDMTKEWLTLFHEGEPTCLAAESLDVESTEKLKTVRESTWLLSAIKSKRGHWTYFDQ